MFQLFNIYNIIYIVVVKIGTIKCHTLNEYRFQQIKNERNYKGSAKNIVKLILQKGDKSDEITTSKYIGNLKISIYECDGFS